MEITIVDQVTDQVMDAISRLLPQLSKTAHIPSKEYLEQMLATGVTTLFMAQYEGSIVGILSLVVYTIPTGQKAWIEDVVSDSTVRGQGIGRQLVEAALSYARTLGLAKIDLTSNNARVAAHALYERLGFKQRETSVFRIELLP